MEQITSEEVYKIKGKKVEANYIKPGFLTGLVRNHLDGTLQLTPIKSGPLYLTIAQQKIRRS